MQKNNLQKYFPIIRTREQILIMIQGNNRLRYKFQKWTPAQQDDFLDFCSGAKGGKILYDSFFKEIFNPEYTPERLNWLLSVILGMKVTILKVLPLDSTRMGCETSLVAMDIVVELEDGSIINVEMQKIGYLFPGQRSACYSSDLLLRQYKRVRSIHEENHTTFKYSDMKPVYTIVFFEKSPTEFKSFPTDYIHRFRQVSDTGMELELLQEYILIPLDIFHEVRQNKPIETEFEAWLTFLSSDKVEDIIQLIEQYPAFKPLYETLYQMCENIEEVMGMFSEELYELDRNTAMFMVDEFSKTIEEQKKLLAELNTELAQKKNALAEQDSILAEQSSVIAERDSALAEKDAEIARLRALLKNKTI